MNLEPLCKKNIMFALFYFIRSIDLQLLFNSYADINFFGDNNLLSVLNDVNITHHD